MTAEEARARTEDYKNQQYDLIMGKIGQESGIGKNSIKWASAITDYTKAKLHADGYRITYPDKVYLIEW
jgi:hypothetical protein